MHISSQYLSVLSVCQCIFCGLHSYLLNKASYHIPWIQHRSPCLLFHGYPVPGHPEGPSGYSQLQCQVQLKFPCRLLYCSICLLSSCSPNLFSLYMQVFPWLRPQVSLCPFLQSVPFPGSCNQAAKTRVLCKHNSLSCTWSRFPDI